MRSDSDEIRDALIRQWEAIDRALPTIDLDRPSRIDGWRNRQVIAHLSLQPVLLIRFIAKPSSQTPNVSLESNLAGTRSLAAVVDAAARDAAIDENTFGKNLHAALPILAAADLAVTVTTFQGPIRLADYIITRCVEAVVHGCDLIQPVEPDPTALAITAEALVSVLVAEHPELLILARALPLQTWVDTATGRCAPSPGLEAALPVMT
ncbi:MAG: maleylpyruvate isomerase N-terminal domain-containing protein [Acidimicrobiia bacterium]